MNKNQFNKLKAKWYKKLKASGFEDIELRHNNLKNRESLFSDTRMISRFQAKQVYYQLATRFLNEYTFKNNRERIIWEYHANGISVRNIVKLLKKVRIKTYRRAVWVIIDNLRNSMKQKYMVK